MTEKDSSQLNWDICGHQKSVEFLKIALANQRVAHAYLFIGPKNVGKHAVVKELVHSIFCKEKNGQVPCRECNECEQIKNNTHPDLYVVKQVQNEKTGKLKRSIAIDQIRDLKNQLQQTTLLSGYKVAVIPEAQLINKNAADALLKILEEPTKKTVIVLIADDEKKLTPTIVSRCQVLRFLPVATKEIEKCLEQKGAPSEMAKKIALISHGRPGLALTLFQHEDQMDKYQKNVDLFFKTIESDIGSRFSLVSEMIDWEKDEAINIRRIIDLFDNWQTVLRDFLLIKSENEPLLVNVGLIKAIKDHADRFSFSQIRDIFYRIRQAKDYFGQNIGSKTVLENLIINL